MNQKISFARPWITDREREAVLEVLRGDILTHGPKAHAFEEEFAREIGDGTHAVAVSSCMAALHLSYWLLDIKAGDEVIVPAQTHTATAHAVELMGARPVFCDCEAQTGNIDPSLIEKLITRRTKAIAIVHFLGIPCDMAAIDAIARRHGLKLVEDCALAVGSRIGGRHVATFGDVGCFSFYPVKHITTGEGGMLVTKHQELAEKARKVRGFGVDRSFSERKIPGMYDVPMLGLNYRMSEVNAAIGREQLLKTKEILDIRGRNFRQLKSALGQCDRLRILDSVKDEFTNSHYCLSAVLQGGIAQKRYAIVGHLNAAGIGTSIYYPQPVPRMAYYAKKYGYQPGTYPQAERISDCSICLPVGPHLTSEDVEYIAIAFLGILERT